MDADRAASLLIDNQKCVIYLSVAQWLNWIEQPPPKGQVGGSNSPWVTKNANKYRHCALFICPLCKVMQDYAASVREHVKNTGIKPVQVIQFCALENYVWR